MQAITEPHPKRRQRAGLVIVTRQSFAIRIRPGISRYEIPRDECQSPAQLRRWLIHMNEKNWFAHEHARELIEAARRVGVMNLSAVAP